MEQVSEQTHNSTSEVWNKPQRILVILAHPDDPEFFCGATIAKWTHEGHQVVYCLITCGDKGSSDRFISTEEICDQRQIEQTKAAEVLGVNQIRFMGYPDGYLVPDLKLRRDITRVIRQEKPDILVTCDPTTLFIDENRLNHPDHRAAGQVVLDAVFPAARDHLYFSELLEEEKLEPHYVKEVWVSLTQHPNVVLDVTQFWETKILALQKHKSQIRDPEVLINRMRNRLAEGSTLDKPRYEEKFYRITFL